MRNSSDRKVMFRCDEKRALVRRDFVKTELTYTHLSKLCSSTLALAVLRLEIPLVRICPCLFATCFNHILEDGENENGLANGESFCPRRHTPWHGMIRSKSQPATICTSRVIALLVELHQQEVGKVENMRSTSYLSPSTTRIDDADMYAD